VTPFLSHPKKVRGPGWKDWRKNLSRVLKVGRGGLQEDCRLGSRRGKQGEETTVGRLREERGR
jgi:hypothetical protein